MKITEALHAEHVVFHNLFDHLEIVLPKAGSLAEVHAMRDMLASMMDAHGKVEHTLLLDPLEHCFDQFGHSESFHNEHEEIEQRLNDVKDATDVDAARQALNSAVLLARDHFDKEERLVFPLAEKHLSEKTLLELGQRWKAEHHADAPAKEV